MDFELTDRCEEFRDKVESFMDERIYPAEVVYKQETKASGDPNHKPEIRPDEVHKRTIFRNEMRRSPDRAEPARAAAR